MNTMIDIIAVALLVTFMVTAILIKQKSEKYDKYISIFFFMTLFLSLTLLSLVFVKIVF